MGGYGVFFGDQRDVAEFIPLGEDQTNNRGELRAALCSLQGHRTGRRTLICPDSLRVVNGVLGWAQRWRQHKWQNASGAVKHVDLWMQILDLVDQLGDTVKWLHVPSHIGIKGNGGRTTWRMWGSTAPHCSTSALAPETQPNTPAKSEPLSPALLWDIDICTPVQLNKRARITTPEFLIP